MSRALEGIEAVVHLSTAVGVGQSMYEIERYTSINALGTAVLLEQVLECRDSIRKVLVASSMSIYGEGQYRNPRAGEGGLAPALRSPSRSSAWASRSGGSTNSGVAGIATGESTIPAQELASRRLPTGMQYLAAAAGTIGRDGAYRASMRLHARNAWRVDGPGLRELDDEWNRPSAASDP